MAQPEKGQRGGSIERKVREVVLGTPAPEVEARSRRPGSLTVRISEVSYPGDGTMRFAFERVILPSRDHTGGSKATFQANAIHHRRDVAILDECGN